MQTKTLILLLTAVAAVIAILVVLVPAAQVPHEPVLPVRLAADLAAASWLGPGYQKRELFDGDRSNIVLLAADVPLEDAEAVVRAIRQGQLINRLPRSSTFYQIPEASVLSIRKGPPRPGRVVEPSVMEYDVVTRTSYDGSSGDGLRLGVRDGQVDVREVFSFIHG